MAILQNIIAKYNATKLIGGRTSRHFLVQSSSNRNSWSNRRRYGI